MPPTRPSPLLNVPSYIRLRSQPASNTRGDWLRKAHTVSEVNMLDKLLQSYFHCLLLGKKCTHFLALSCQKIFLLITFVYFDLKTKSNRSFVSTYISTLPVSHKPVKTLDLIIPKLLMALIVWVKALHACCWLINPLTQIIKYGKYITVGRFKQGC